MIEATAIEDQLLGVGLVDDGDPHPLGRLVVGIDQRLATAQEEGISTPEVQRAAQRRLKTYPIPFHPVGTGLRGPYHMTGQLLVGLPARDAPHVLEELLLQVGVAEHVRGLAMHAAQVAGMAAVASAPLPRRAFQQQYAGSLLSRTQGSTERRIAAPDDQHVVIEQIILAQPLSR